MSSRSFLLLSLVAILALVSTLALQPQVLASPDSYYPSGYVLGGSTSWLSGDVSDLTSNDGVYTTFRSYYSGTDTSDFVNNNTSDLDSSADKGTHGDFLAQQAGPDSIFDTLTEANIGGTSNTTLIDAESFEGTWPPTGWRETGNWYREFNYAYDGTWSADFDGGWGFGASGYLTSPSMNCSDTSVIYVDFWWYDNGLDNDDLELEYYDGSVWNNYQDLHLLEPGNGWHHYTEKVTDNQYFVSNFQIRWWANSIGSGETGCVDLVAVKKEISGADNYELDLEVQWTDLSYSLPNEELCIYGGTMDAEDIRVDVWNGSDWENLFTDLTSGWNNVSVSSYLTSSNFVIRFKGGNETGDTSQDSWNTDVTLLHAWSNEYTTEVEFTGLSDTETWAQLDWSVDSAWTVGSINVTLQLYNYFLGDYPTNGNGYLSYTSSATTNTDETKNQTITVNPTHFRNATGYWKAKVKGVKQQRFDFKADLIKYEATSVAPPDVAVLNITVSSTSVSLGDTVAINVTVKNEGETTETFNVALYYDSTAIGTQIVTDLEPGTEATLRFSWDTTDVTPDVSYAIKAEASGAAGETDTDDNTFTYDNVEVKSQGTSPPFDWNPILSYLIPILLGVLGFVVAGIVWKKREEGLGFEFFNEMTAGGIPDAYSTMILGDEGSGKSVLCQQLINEYLTQGKSCVYITYDIFPFEARENMKTFLWDVSPYEEKGTFKFVDAYSSTAGQKSEEEYCVGQPFALSDVGIRIFSVMNAMKHKSTRVFLDSTVPLFSRLDPSKVAEFLQDRSAKIKGNNGAFFFTLGKGTVPSGPMNRLEETVDCIIDLDTYEKKGENWKRMRIRKLRGRRVADVWIPFKIESNKGITFLPPKDWSKSRSG